MPTNGVFELAGAPPVWMLAHTCRTPDCPCRIDKIMASHDGEQALLQAIMHLKRLQATVVIITHKTSLLAAVDKLLVVQDGALVAFGPRDVVLAQLMKQQQGPPPGPQSAPPAAASVAVVSREAAYV